MTVKMQVAWYVLGSVVRVPIMMCLARAIKKLGLDKLFLVQGVSLAKTFSGWSNVPILGFLVVASALEECLFRWLGAALFGRSWLAGAAIAVVFACVHSLQKGRWMPRSVPLPQLVGGVWYWIGFTLYGLPVAILAHSLYNVCGVGWSMHGLAKKGMRLGDVYEAQRGAGQ